MTAHELAYGLLAQPNVPVIIPNQYNHECERVKYISFQRIVNLKDTADNLVEAVDEKYKKYTGLYYETDRTDTAVIFLES